MATPDIGTSCWFTLILIIIWFICIHVCLIFSMKTHSSSITTYCYTLTFPSIHLPRKLLCIRFVWQEQSCKKKKKCCKIPLEMHTQNASLHVKRLVNTYKPRFLSQTVKSQVASKRYINWRWHPCLNPDMNAESVGEKNLQRDLRVAQKSINTSRGQGHVWGWRLNHFSIVFFFSDLILYLYIFLLGFITIFFSCILVYFADIILLILCHLNHHQYHHYN